MPRPPTPQGAFLTLIMMHAGVPHVQAFDDGVPEKFTALNDSSAHDFSHDDQI